MELVCCEGDCHVIYTKGSSNNTHILTHLSRRLHVVPATYELCLGSGQSKGFSLNCCISYVPFRAVGNNVTSRRSAEARGTRTITNSGV